MAYTEAQWNKFQAALPEEERMSYLDYLKETDPAEYSRVVSSILENLKTAELQSGTPITQVVDERTKIAGAKTDKAAQKAAVKATGETVASALRKLQSGATLTSAENKLLGITPKTITAPTGPSGTSGPSGASVPSGTSGEPAGKPGNAWIVSADGKTWVQPTKPTDGKNYNWDDNNGWVVTNGQNTDEYTTVNGIFNFKGTPFTGSYNGKNYKDGKIVEAPSGDGYETIGGLLTFKGTAFTGSYNGKNYKNGFLEETPNENKYTTVNGVLTLNGKAFTGVYENKEYKDGVEVVPGGDGYETVNGLLVYKGTAFTGTYNGKKYKNGFVEEEANNAEYTTVDGVLNFKGSPFTGAYNGKTYKDGKVVQEPSGDEYTTTNGILMFKGAAFTGNYQGKNYKDGKVVEAAGDQYTTVNGLFTLNGKAFTGTYEGKNYKDGKVVVAEDAAVDDAAAIIAKAGRQSAYDLLYTQFASYGLGSLVEPLKALIQTNVSPSEFAIKLRNDPLYNTAYKKRFAANDMRISKGLKAIDEATYLGLEDQYQSILRNAGLPESYWKRGELGIQEGFTNFIANDVSATELEDRVNTAQQRVLYANPEVSIALKTFYPDISNGDLLAYALDPTKGLDQIKRRITAAEIGSSAVQMGLATNVTDAEYLARYGVNKAQAQQGYGTIAGGLQRGSQLASIYGENPYTQTTAEQEVFAVPGAAEAKAARQKITGLEKATFGGQTGLTSGALARDRAGGF